jgi:SAM-dependent methyltransferase
MPRVYTGVSESWHEDYERGRPGWPRAVLDVPGLASAGAVVELGAGTGKLTRLLVEVFDDVVAIEPDAGMRRVLVATCPGVRVLDGSAEAIPLPEGSADAVFVAEAFHNFDAAAAVAEIARVLRPGGMVVLLWNVPAGPTEPSIAPVEALLAEVGPTREEVGHDPFDLHTDRFASGAWKQPFGASPFDELREERLANAQTVDRDGLVAFFASMGWLADRPDAERLPLLDRVRTLLDADEYRRPWETRLFWTRLQV